MTSVRQVKWTNRGRKRFREQQDYITNDNCRGVAIERARRVVKARREFCDILSVRHTAFLIKSMHSL